MTLLAMNRAHCLALRSSPVIRRAQIRKIKPDAVFRIELYVSDGGRPCRIEHMKFHTGGKAVSYVVAAYPSVTDIEFRPF